MAITNSDIQKDIWYSSPSFYTYNPDVDLYTQIDEIVTNKLLWYDKLLCNINDFYDYDKWCDLSLNLRYAKLTTITNPEIERDIALSTNNHETFYKIIFAMPYFIWRDPNTSNVIEEYKQENIDVVNKLYKKCRVPINVYQRIWNNNIFEYTGHRYNDDFNVNIDNISYNIICDDDNIIYKSFTFTKTDSVIDLTNFNTDDDDLLSVNIKCDSTTLRNLDNMFRNCKLLSHVDLSQCNIDYTTSLKSMFEKCVNLKFVDLSNSDFSTMDKDTDDMFKYCHNLRKIKLNNCSQHTIDKIKCAVIQSGLNKDNIEFIY